MLLIALYQVTVISSAQKVGTCPDMCPEKVILYSGLQLYNCVGEIWARNSE